jgi:hypothetical protein
MIVKNEFKKSFTCIITRTQERKNTIKCQTDNHHKRSRHKHNHKHNR